MKDAQPTISKMWEQITRRNITPESIQDLSRFKSGLVNYKLSIWNPGTNGLRYLKALIYNLAAGLSPAQWNLLCRVHGRELGTPYAIKFHGELVCLDYVQAVFETEFISDCLDLTGARLLEIGAGYGRSCHTLLANFDLAGYTILDLDITLDLSRKYLKAVLPSHEFDKIEFRGLKDFPSMIDQRFDLCLNIDSFAEMEPSTVKQYLGFIDRSCRNLYVKNPVGKYLDPDLDSHSSGQDEVRLALATGLLQNIIDIHDNAQVEAQAVRFVAAYAPSAAWETLAHGWARPWSYYWQALYRHTNPPAQA